MNEWRGMYFLPLNGFHALLMYTYPTFRSNGPAAPPPPSPA